MSQLHPLPGTVWRPWGVDALATVVSCDERTVTVRYDHDPKSLHTLSRDAYGRIGREVHRTDYERWKTDVAIAAGTIVTGYALIVSHSNADDFDEERTRYLSEYADRQPYHVGLGLVHRHRLMLELEPDDDD